MIYKKIVVLGILIGMSGLAYSFLHTTSANLVVSATPVLASIHKTILIATTSSEISAEEVAGAQDTEPVRTRASKENVTETKKKKDEAKQIAKIQKSVSSRVFAVPFYSQFTDITSATWKKVGCGVTSLAMLIDFYKPGTVTVDTLLDEGITAGAYLDSAGWTYTGLIGLSQKYGFGGTTHDMANSTMELAFNELQATLSEGPVMASVHYSFDPQSPIPHLVVVNGIKDGMVYYNDPAGKAGAGSITIAKFQKSWKKRYIEIRPLS